MPAEIDMSNQVDNEWEKKTVLALVQEDLRYSVVIEAEPKLKIKELCDNIKTKNVSENAVERFKNRVVSLIHAYMLYKIIFHNKEKLFKLSICSDTHPKHLHNLLQNISQNKGFSHILNNMKIKYGLEKDNNAQLYAKSVFHGDIKPTYILSKNDIEEIFELINKFIQKVK